MPLSTLKYSNGEVTVIWKPDTCIHSRICWTELQSVFNPSQKPWVNMEGAGTEKIIEQVKKCPSGALSYQLNKQMENEQKETSESANVAQILIKPNGPILVTSDCVITHSNGVVENKKATTAFCRCGASANKPFCDGSHRKIEFKG